ncbi:Uncharacterized protein TCM_043527 [Theobroma cacao]|uniref:Uncharacterized protein n=1 Tax=Theobroma cacao TaxID=3641 RepID=A0A061FQM8_THECC|nr:Uncharacterized protein TCM_043527 [Theobroma cacao]
MLVLISFSFLSLHILINIYGGGSLLLLVAFSKWFMLVNLLITFVLGSALAWLFIKMTKTPKHLQAEQLGIKCYEMPLPIYDGPYTSMITR